MRTTNKILLNAIRGKATVVNSEKIVISPSPNASKGSADHELTEEELIEATKSHIEDVKKGMNFIAKLIRKTGEDHDWTKLRYSKSFFEDFSAAQKTGVWTDGWFNRVHVRQERHHILDRVPDDITLIDVLEHIVDCVMAGLARNGEFKADTLGEGTLLKAYMNTQKLIESAVEVAK